MQQLERVDLSRIQDSRDIYGMILSWIFLEAVVFILATLAYSLKPYGTQIIPNSCNVFNSINGKQLNNLYYHLFDGISTQPNSCENDNSGNFWCATKMNYIIMLTHMSLIFDLL